MKIIPVGQLDSISQEDSLNEVKILSSLDNYYIVKYFDSFVEENQLHIVMEYCEKGDLSKLIKSRTKPFAEPRIWEIFLQICLGLEHLHRVKVLHRDIKTMNLFLFDEKSIRIGDLGIARVLSSTTTFAHTVVGTPYYLSPELCEEKPYNSKSDIWALGCVLYELCALKKPFDATNPGALILKILRSTYAPLSNTFSSELREIVKLCLLKDHKKRPDIIGILKRPGIKEKALSFNIPIPENSILNIARISIKKSIDEAEEEKSLPRKKNSIIDSKKPPIKPRVRKGAPLECKKPLGYAKLPKKLTTKKSEDIKIVANLPIALPVNLKPPEEEESIFEESSYEIITSEPPPPQNFIFTKVKPAVLTNDSESDDQSYHSDEKELFQIKEADDRLENTDQEKNLKLIHLQNQQKHLERIIHDKSEDIIEKLGFNVFHEIHSYFKQKYVVRFI